MISRPNWEPRPSHRVCSLHFVDGFPSELPEDINYRPTLLLQSQNSATVAFQADATSTSTSVQAAVVDCEQFENVMIVQTGESRKAFHSYSRVADDEPVNENSKSIQTDLTMDLIARLERQASTLQQQNSKLQKDVTQSVWGIHRIMDNDKKTRFYTGLPTFAIFL